MSEVTKHPKEPKTVARCWLWRRLRFISPVWFVAEQDVSARPLSDELYGLWVMQSMAARSHSQNLCWHKSAASSRQKEPHWYTVLVPQALFTLLCYSVGVTFVSLLFTLYKLLVWKRSTLVPLWVKLVFCWQRTSCDGSQCEANKHISQNKLSLTTAGVCSCRTAEVVRGKRQLLPAGGSVLVTQPVSLAAPVDENQEKEEMMNNMTRVRSIRETPPARCRGASCTCLSQ